MCEQNRVSLTSLTQPGLWRVRKEGLVDPPPPQYCLTSERLLCQRRIPLFNPSFLRKTVHRPKSSFTLGGEKRSRQVKEGRKNEVEKEEEEE